MRTANRSFRSRRRRARRRARLARTPDATGTERQRTFLRCCGGCRRVRADVRRAAARRGLRRPDLGARPHAEHDVRRCRGDVVPPSRREGRAHGAVATRLSRALHRSRDGARERRRAARGDRALPAPDGRHVVARRAARVASRALAGDASMVAVRGQVVRVEQFGLDRYILDEQSTDGIAYVYPRSHDVILGGTREPGNERIEPDPQTARAIIARCSMLEPRVAAARIVSHAVGLRPGRPAVRLEAERPGPGRLLVHDYGHGGSGVTLSWGCAEDVAALIRADRPATAG